MRLERRKQIFKYKPMTNIKGLRNDAKQRRPLILPNTHIHISYLKHSENYFYNELKRNCIVIVSNIMLLPLRWKMIYL
jgi:hypothetical protein